MNLKEITLNEVQLQPTFISEGISALLHTILCLRAPNVVKLQDHLCTKLAPLSFAKCGAEDVDITVRDAIFNLERSLTLIGPEITRGCIILTFFEKREQRSFFGLLSNQEKMCFERWKIPVVVDPCPLPQNVPSSLSAHLDANESISAVDDGTEPWCSLDTARDQIQERILTILETVNGSMDHVPPSIYEYEIEVCGPVSERRSEPSIVTRLINSPP